MRRHLLLPFLIAGAVPHSFAQAPVPELNFTDPPGFYRSASYPPADFSSMEVNASIQVYPFQVFNGDVRLAFSRTLLRDLIDPRYRETGVAPGARLEQFSMPGADTVLRAHFLEPTYGQMRERVRMVLVKGTAIAIVDTSALNGASYQRILPQLHAFSASLSVSSGKPQPTYGAHPGSAGRAVAGLYMGFKSKFVSGVFGIPGTSRTVNALHYYLFSADGQVYRAYDELSVPGNDPSRFDFAAARRADPENSGQYTIRGNSILVRIGQQPPETLELALPSGNTIRIGSISYERQ